jgi:hypothetical protein
VSFFSAAAEEMAARRLRLHKRFKPFLAGLIEFVILAGFVLGVAAVFLGRWYGFLPLAAFALGSFLLERRRQGALAAGQGEEIVRPRYDRLTLAMTAALAIIGIWVFVGAMRAKQAEGWAPPPPHTVDLDLVTE